MSARISVRITAAALALAVGVLLHPLDALAQEGTITGRVVAAGSLQPLAGAQVEIPELGLGALAASDGRYSIGSVPEGTHEVRVTLLGYDAGTEVVSVGTGETVELNFQLSQRALALDQVIVTGTPGGTQRRAIGNVVDVMDAAEIRAILPTPDVQSLMGQRVPGLIQLGQSGEAGGGNVLRVRGLTSIGLTNSPLVYLDGVRIDSDPRRGISSYGVGVSRLNTLNPADIESIEVIKGPAAATLYGTEASAGVIQIITRRGSAGAPSFDFSTTVGTSWIWVPAQRAGMRWGIVDGEPVGVNLYEQERALGNDIFTYGRLGTSELSMRGGTESVRYFLSGGWSHDRGVVHYNYDQRLSARANLEFLLHDNLTVRTNLGYVRGENRAHGTTHFNSPLDQLTAGGPAIQRSRGFLTAPPEEWDFIEARSDVDRITGNIEANLTTGDWLSQRFIVGVDLNSEQNWELWPRHPDGANHYFGNMALGQKESERVRRQNLTVDYGGTATFDLTDRLSSASSVGFQYYRTVSDMVGGTATEFPAVPITTLTGGASRLSVEDWLENASVGVYVQQQFGWEDRAFFTAAVRGDDNSAFGEDFDAAIYPKVSATWVMSEEPFWTVDWVDEFRLRSAWGAAGRQPGAFDAPRLYAPFLGFQDQPGLEPMAFGNPELEPERSTELELGFDASLLDGRLQVEYTRQQRRTTDMIVPRGIALSLGFPGNQIVNVGEVKSWGNELSLQGQAMQRPGFRLQLGANFATMENEITSLGDLGHLPGPGSIQHREGYSIGDIYMLRVLDAETDANGVLLSATCDGGTGPQGVDMGGAPVPCQDAPRVRYGSTEPTWELGFHATGTLRDRLTLHARVDGTGGHVLQGTRYIQAHTSTLSTEAAVLRNDPQDAIFEAYRVHHRDPLGFFRAGSARLREVSATYSLPETLAGRVGANGGSVTLSGSNLFVLWTAQEGWNFSRDPSIETHLPGGARLWDPAFRLSGDISTGGGYGVPPVARTSLTVRLSF